jgi:predicted nucleic acid-binding Zn finger protein
MTSKKRETVKVHVFTPAEQRAARSERIKVYEAEPYGWIAYSEAGGERDYHLFRDPETKHLACTCADFAFRGNAEPGFECKHVSAVLKFIARQYLMDEYDPRKQQARAA